MAGDWIKVSTGLPKHPKVVRMASALKADRFRIVGGLVSAWCLFDEFTTDGVLVGYTPAALDEMAGFPGLAQAMVDVGWLQQPDPETLVMPEFLTHNGASAKRRALDADRKRAVRNESASEADAKRTRGEERREDSKSPPKPPQGEQGAQPKAKRTARANGTTLEAWLGTLAKDEKAIPAGHPVFEFAKDAGIPAKYIRLAWVEFRAYHLARPDKKQIDWRSTFGNYVRQNYLRLWAPAATGGYDLTPKGVQAMRALESKDGANE